jgi:hypothetical protein
MEAEIVENELDWANAYSGKSHPKAARLRADRLRKEVKRLGRRDATVD